MRGLNMANSREIGRKLSKKKLTNASLEIYTTTTSEGGRKSSGPVDTMVSIAPFPKYTNLNDQNQGCWGLKKFCTHMRALIPFVLLLGFSGIGGLLFSHFEGNNQRQADVEHKAFLNSRTDKSSQRIAADFYENGLLYLNYSDGLEQLTAAVTYEIQQFGQDIGLITPKDFEEWTFLGSVYFSLSLSTTIGYGNIHPETTVGRVLAILYGVIGIPLTIYTLNELGKILLTIIWKAYLMVRIKLLRCGFCRPKMLEDMAEFPLTLALLLTLGWMLLCSYLFCMWEDWDYFISFYFFFMSLTTIGLGDVTPKYPSYMIGSFALIMVGMALVSMCFNLIELKLQSLVKKTMMHIQSSLHVNESDSPAELRSRCGSLDILEDKKIVIDPETLESNRSVNILEENNKFMNIFNDKDEGWLHTLLGKESKQVLQEEWQRKTALRNRGTQCSRPKTLNKATQYNPPEEYHPPQNYQLVPMRELKMLRSPSQINEFYLLTNQLKFILSDCQQMLHNPSDN